MYTSWRDGCIYTFSTSGKNPSPAASIGLENVSWMHQIAHLIRNKLKNCGENMRTQRADLRYLYLTRLTEKADAWIQPIQVQGSFSHSSWSEVQKTPRSEPSEQKITHSKAMTHLTKMHKLYECRKYMDTQGMCSMTTIHLTVKYGCFGTVGQVGCHPKSELGILTNPNFNDHCRHALYILQVMC